SVDAGSLEEKYYNAFLLAENHLKNAEYIDQSVLIPAINELRYAGSHAAHALVAASEEKRIESYQKVTIGNVIPSYSTHCCRLQEIKEGISQQSDKNLRCQYIEQCLPELKNIFREWDNSREELNKKVWAEINRVCYCGVTIILAFLSFLFAVLMFFRC
ncbi:MAG: hypothetical protein LBE12_06350, partial [Planctomycetaceae bacterium]|nr:hypothetical protein [Planctomycetaceae bacterium]